MCAESDVSKFIHVSAIGANENSKSLYQKSKFVMHGSAFKKDDDSVLFLGESGSGKSSLVASLIDYGEDLSEDLCLIDFNEQGDSFISPSLPFIKL